jgi:hypothetical protein
MKTLIVQIKCKLGEAYRVAAYMDNDVDPGVFVNTRLHNVPGIADTNTTIAFNAFTPSKKI